MPPTMVATILPATTRRTAATIAHGADTATAAGAEDMATQVGAAADGAGATKPTSSGYYARRTATAAIIAHGADAATAAGAEDIATQVSAATDWAGAGKLTIFCKVSSSGSDARTLVDPAPACPRESGVAGVERRKGARAFVARFPCQPPCGFPETGT